MQSLLFLRVIIPLPLGAYARRTDPTCLATGAEGPDRADSRQDEAASPTSITEENDVGHQTEALDGKAVAWMEKVSDEQYRAGR
jgi:hypothetical protein